MMESLEDISKVGTSRFVVGLMEVITESGCLLERQGVAEDSSWSGWAEREEVSRNASVGPSKARR